MQPQSRLLHQSNPSQGPRVASTALKSQAQQITQQSDSSVLSGQSSHEFSQDSRYKPLTSAGYTLEERYSSAKKDEYSRQPGESAFSRYTGYDRSNVNTNSAAASHESSGLSGGSSALNPPSSLSGTGGILSSESRGRDNSSKITSVYRRANQPSSSQIKYIGLSGNKPITIPQVKINLNPQSSHNADSTSKPNTINYGTSGMRYMSSTQNTPAANTINSNSGSTIQSNTGNNFTSNVGSSSSIHNNPYYSQFSSSNYQSYTTALKPSQLESQKQKISVNYEGSSAGVSSTVGQNATGWTSRYATLTKPSVPAPVVAAAVATPPQQFQSRQELYQESHQIKQSPYQISQQSIHSQQSKPQENYQHSEIQAEPIDISPKRIDQMITKSEILTKGEINTPDKQCLIQYDSRASIETSKMGEASSLSRKKESSRTYDLFDTERKINLPRFACESSEPLNEMEKLREQNRVLNRQLINLRVIADNGRSSELQMAKSENKSLRDQIVSLKLMHEERANDALDQIQRLRYDSEEYRKSKEMEIYTLKQESDDLLKKTHQLKDIIDKMELKKQQQPKDLLSLRMELARWEDECENIKLEHKVALDMNMKNADQVQTYKTILEKSKLSEKSKEIELNSLHQKRIDLEGQVVQLNNKLQRQKGQYIKAVGKHTEYERQITALKNEIEALNKAAENHSSEKNELNLKVHEMKLERKNLMEYSRRASNTEIQESKIIQDKNMLLDQLKEKVVEIGQLKNRIAEMAAEMSRQRDHREITGLKDKIARLQLDNQKLRKFNKNPAGQFDEVLKSQLTQAQKYKQSLNSKTEEIYKLREELNASRSELDQYQRQVDFDMLKLNVEKKNMLSGFKIQKEAFATEMEVLRKGVKMQEDKAKYWSQQNRKKDEFMKTYLLARVNFDQDRGFIKEFFKQFEAHMPRPQEYD